MSVDTAPAQEARARLDSLLGYLDQDPNNHALLVDTAQAAADAGDGAQARRLLDRAAAIVPPGARERSIAGLIAMHEKDYDSAASIFAALIDEGEDRPALRFNLAWSLAASRDDKGALAALGPDAARALPEAAALEVQLLHSLGEVDSAFERGKEHLALYPDARALNAAMSVLAIDMSDEALAARCAANAPGHPDALATLGTLALGSDNATGAEALFSDAITRNPNVPRAWVGRGLAHLLTGKPEAAPAEIDRGAEMFGDHLGSWIAAGWAYFINGDLENSRMRFERALSIDATFAETHGSLAVLDLLAGNVDAARDRAEIARRLDRHSFSTALAYSLLSAAGGDRERARAIVQTALQTPIDGGNRTIGQALARMGMALPG